ncbi:hypothetical protein ATO10_11702 [Actibacterium atlanticum]|uniref:T6SS Phospholipase effector Tle1-like catalytic domain-containing protein n=1 Tax=Actibacterium atlanticum TaxID=1461693 RepID=A0A058ZK34_9RHOB|nr:DUF2235 domain-containing protein [Actibacterium atlanticum]KCV81575.1 hypothetical protein ATO10_11702 [Actibacterium atlanticum]
MRSAKRFWNWLRGTRTTEAHSPVTARGSVTHIVILDGTMSSLEPGCETNAGLIYKLLCDQKAQDLSLYYEAGIQWREWRDAMAVITGRGINRQIRRAYGYLASRYHPGDKIILLGYSRGAFAARSLAGVLDRVGLLQANHATERNVQVAYRHYQSGARNEVARAFSATYCLPEIQVEMVGVFDTVKALGVRLPILWKFTEPNHAFHNHAPSGVMKRGFQALALNETRQVFAPVIWECTPEWKGRVEQVWFKGCHGDVGGQLGEVEEARPLANIPLVWMLGKLESCGVRLPQDWLERFPCDVHAPSIGSFRGWGKMFLLRKKRYVGGDPSESLHSTVTGESRADSLPSLEVLGNGA